MDVSTQMITCFFVGFFSPSLLLVIIGVFISLKRSLHSALDD